MTTHEGVGVEYGQRYSSFIDHYEVPIVPFQTQSSSIWTSINNNLYSTGHLIYRQTYQW